MNKLLLTEVPLRQKRVLVRVDFNVPLDEQGIIVDDTRIRAALPTINFLLDEDAKVIIASHLGRPKGKVVPALSMRPVARRLKRFLDKEVTLAEDCIGEKVKSLIDQMRPGDV
ncbi:MAG TPA: phosphoglycerate kinase, partial [Candidatus Brocadiales bacterium]|nr:phosphoglycerate kinase [Candidatus Brocadiales bacterium]